MRIVTVSCREDEFFIKRGNLHNTNDIAGSWCFGSRLHIPQSSDVSKLEDYDAVWFTMYGDLLRGEGRWMELMCDFKSKWPQKKVILHQTGEAEYYLNLSATGQWHIQSGWLEALKDKVDLLLTHNARDSALYGFFLKSGKVETWRTVQDVDEIVPLKKTPKEKEKVVGVSTYDNRAGGIVGVSVASKVTKNIKQITRTFYKNREARDGFINDLFEVSPVATPICGWFEFLENLSGLYVYLHPMPAASAGRDTIACAALGVPVVGNKNLDAQTHLFPDLAVDVFDARKMEQLVRDLLYDHAFYERAREKAMKGAMFYNIDYGVERAEKIMTRLGWE